MFGIRQNKMETWQSPQVEWTPVITSAELFVLINAFKKSGAKGWNKGFWAFFAQYKTFGQVGDCEV